MTRLDRQLAFVRELDRLKGVLRQTWLLDTSRRENSAEHAWHVALMAVLFAEHAARPVDVARVVKMLLVHDVVEIDAGDTFLYDEAGAADKAAREKEAAERLFGLLPEDQGGDLRALWEEYEAGESADAAFAAALDRFQPLMHNVLTKGRVWREHGITEDRVVARNRHMEKGAPALWEKAEAMIAESVENGWLDPAQPKRSARR